MLSFIGLCKVTQWLQDKMLEGAHLSHIATGSLLMIEELFTLGVIRLLTSDVEVGPGTYMHMLSYEERIMNCATYLRRSNSLATVIIVSHSQSLKNRARANNHRSYIPLDLLV